MHLKSNMDWRRKKASGGGVDKQGEYIWVGYKLIGVLIIVLSLGQLALSNYLATEGAKLAMIKDQTNRLGEEDNLLQASVNRYFSLNVIAGQDSALGFSKTSAQVVFANEKTSVALR